MYITITTAFLSAVACGQNCCKAALFWPQLEYNMIDFSATQEQKTMT